MKLSNNERKNEGAILDESEALKASISPEIFESYD